MSRSPPPRTTPSPLLPVHTIRTLTGSDVFPPTSPPSPTSPPPSNRRYSRHNILIFRTADGEERYLRPSRPTSPHATSNATSLTNRTNQTTISTSSNYGEQKPRLSSLTDSSNASPHHSPTTSNVQPIVLKRLPDVQVTRLGAVDSDDDDAVSTYSHASALNVDDLDDDDLEGIRDHGVELAHITPVISRQLLEIRRQSFINSFAKAREARDTRLIVAPPVKQRQHPSALSIMERCIRAITELLDMNVAYARLVNDRFQAFSALFTKEERHVISELLKEAATRLRREAPTPWRSPVWAGKKSKIAASSTNQLANIFRNPWLRKSPKMVNSDTLVRAVVFGNHIIPGVQSAESILLRMAGEYQREEVNRKAPRAERIDVPLSFAMTLMAALATFSRLDCATSYRRYRSRSASKRKSNPHVMMIIKTKYDGLKLSFGVTLHGESPCTVLFRRPRIFSLRKIDDYANLVTEAKDIMLEFGREIVANSK